MGADRLLAGTDRNAGRGRRGRSLNPGTAAVGLIPFGARLSCTHLPPKADGEDGEANTIDKKRVATQLSTE